jgi:uncharacterized integral membrane protein
MIKAVKIVFLTLLFMLGIALAVENTEPVALSYFGHRLVPMPLFALVLVSVLAGVLLAAAAFLVDLWSLRRALREKDRELAALRARQSEREEEPLAARHAARS